MQGFLDMHPDISVAVLFFIASALGAGGGYVAGRSLWRLCAGKVPPVIARAGALAWFLLWSVALAAFIFAAETAALEYWNIATAFFLMAASNWTLLTLFPFLGAGCALLWRAMRAELPRSPLHGLHALWRALWVPLCLFALAFGAFAFFREPALAEKQRAEATVAQIQARKITLDEVMGKDLPPPPQPAAVNATVAGVDANGNGIRDDVELAIFALHPNSARIRAAELQYAMALQSELTDVFDSSTLVAASQEAGRGILCIGETAPKVSLSSSHQDVLNAFAIADAHQKEVEGLVLNTTQRIQARDSAFQFMVSHGDLSGPNCDVDLSVLPN